MMKELAPGIESKMELGMLFWLWAASRRRTPRYDDVMAYFSVSKPTACRYLQCYRNVLAKQEAKIGRRSKVLSDLTS